VFGIDGNQLNEDPQAKLEVLKPYEYHQVGDIIGGKHYKSNGDIETISDFIKRSCSVKF
jgi:hypothetical protein